MDSSLRRLRRQPSDGITRAKLAAMEARASRWRQLSPCVSMEFSRDHLGQGETSIGLFARPHMDEDGHFWQGPKVGVGYDKRGDWYETEELCVIRIFFENLDSQAIPMEVLLRRYTP